MPGTKERDVCAGEYINAKSDGYCQWCMRRGKGRAQFDNRVVDEPFKELFPASITTSSLRVLLALLTFVKERLLIRVNLRSSAREGFKL